MANAADEPNLQPTTAIPVNDAKLLVSGVWDKRLVDTGYRPEPSWPVQVAWFPDAAVREVFAVRASHPPMDRRPLDVPLVVIEDVILAVTLPGSAPLYVRQIRESHYIEVSLTRIDGSGGFVTEAEAAALVVAYRRGTHEAQPPLREAAEQYRDRMDLAAAERRFADADQNARPPELSAVVPGGGEIPPVAGGDFVRCPLRIAGDGVTVEGIQPDGSYLPLGLADPEKPLTGAMLANLRALIDNFGTPNSPVWSGNYSAALAEAEARVSGLIAYIVRPRKAGGGVSGRIKLRLPLPSPE